MAVLRVLAAVLVLTVSVMASDPTSADPFAFFQPWVEVSQEERARLAAGEVLVHTLPADDGNLAIFAAARLKTGPDALIEWTHAIKAFKESQHVIAVQRFSEPPVIGDLAALTVDEGDLEELRDCRPGDCGVKLGAEEITAVQRAIRSGGSEWKAAAQQEVRRLLLARVNVYRQSGLAGLPAYADRKQPVSPRDTFSAILAQSLYLTERLPAFAAALTSGSTVPGGDSFFYWSKERYGAGKHVITLSHVQMLRPEGGSAIPDAIVGSTQIFASHYTDGALGLTTVSCAAEGADCYLAYVNRTQVDLLGGMLGSIKRLIFEKRIASGTPDILRELRRRLESGPPPATEPMDAAATRAAGPAR